MSDHDNEHRPIAGLVWMAVFLVVLALGWLNVYLRLWF